MIDFQIPRKIKFGLDVIQTLPDEVLNFNPQKVGIITDEGIENSGILDLVVDVLDQRNLQVEIFINPKGEPSFDLLNRKIEEVKGEECDLIIGLGGGSVMDVAKTVAALLDKDDYFNYLFNEKEIEKRNIPCLLLPTTSGTGAEVTMNAIFSDEKNKIKTGIVSPSLIPDIAIIDPKLTLSCPSNVTASSGVDALTHAIESYWAVRANPYTKLYAQRAIELFPKYIVQAVEKQECIKSREGMSWVSNLAGISLANAGVGAVHALAYPLGGKYQIDHGVSNALLLPYVLNVVGKYNLKEIEEFVTFLQLEKRNITALECLVNYLFELLQEIDLPLNLKRLGVSKSSLPNLAKQAIKIKRLIDNTPYKLSYEEVLDIYERAYVGL